MRVDELLMGSAVGVSVPQGNKKQAVELKGGQSLRDSSPAGVMH